MIKRKIISKRNLIQKKLNLIKIHLYLSIKSIQLTTTIYFISTHAPRGTKSILSVNNIIS